MQEFGLTVPFKNLEDWSDIMPDIQRRLRDAQKQAMDNEVTLSCLRYDHPVRARRWRKAQQAYALWLSQIYPPKGPECCETCGQPLPDYDDD